MLVPWKKSYDQPRQHIKKQRHFFADKRPSSHSYGFSSSHLWMWELDYKETWALKNWCFWTAVLEKTLESPLDGKEIQPVSPEGNQSWIFAGRTDAEAETPILWPILCVGWHHQYNGHGFGWTPEVGDGQGALACCGSQDRRVRHDWVTEMKWMNDVTGCHDLSFLNVEL